MLKIVLQQCFIKLQSLLKYSCAWNVNVFVNNSYHLECVNILETANNYIRLSFSFSISF